MECFQYKENICRVVQKYNIQTGTYYITISVQSHVNEQLY